MKPLSREVNGTRNRILGRLPNKDFRPLRRRMKLVELALGTSLYEPHTPLERVYFPEEGVASILTRLDDGTETEVATVGREGMVGLAVFLASSRFRGVQYGKFQARPWCSRQRCCVEKLSMGEP
jgi:CRP-like cAMP-binding protein